ncbi:MAG: hypothetical protein H6Q69_2859 [Firmicutes bacterium]|nr:hypothetical protein [Bacillota bacterium]
MLYGSDSPYTPKIATVTLAGSLEETEQFNVQEKEMIFTKNALTPFPRLSSILGIDREITKENKKYKKSCNAFKRKIIAFVYRRFHP